MPTVDHDKLTKQTRRLTAVERHVLVCVDDDCDDDKRSFKQLKRRCKEVGLAVRVQRTAVRCFDVCKQGPVVLVEPEGIWYAKVTPRVIDRIVDEHLVGGRPVEEFVFATRASFERPGG